MSSVSFPVIILIWSLSLSPVWQDIEGRQDFSYNTPILFFYSENNSDSLNRPRNRNLIDVQWWRWGKISWVEAVVWIAVLLVPNAFWYDRPHLNWESANGARRQPLKSPMTENLQNEILIIFSLNLHNFHTPWRPWRDWHWPFGTHTNITAWCLQYLKVIGVKKTKRLSNVKDSVKV